MLAASEVQTNHAQLFSALLACVSAAGTAECQGGVLAAAVEVLLLLFGAGNQSGDEVADRGAALALMAALCKLRGQLAGGGPPAAAVAQLGSALAERCTAVCCLACVPEVCATGH